VVTCSPSDQRRLFESVLAGLGQCAVIVRATVRLIPMQTNALTVRLTYDDLQASLADIAMLVRDGRFDSFEQLAHWVNGSWIYQLEAAAYFTPPGVPDVEALLAGLHDKKALRVISPVPYLAWLSRLDVLITASRANRYVLFSGILSEASSPAFLEGEVFAQTNQELGADRVLLVPFSRRNVTKPLLSLPDSDVQFAFLIFRTPDDEQQQQSFLAANRLLYDRQVAVGGKRYPWDAIPDFTRADWAEHYGPSWQFLRSSKRRYDPAGILGPGPGIFG
jgi:FAD/FMN-containing dehydrogenase